MQCIPREPSANARLRTFVAEWIRAAESQACRFVCNAIDDVFVSHTRSMHWWKAVHVMDTGEQYAPWCSRPSTRDKSEPRVPRRVGTSQHRSQPKHIKDIAIVRMNILYPFDQRTGRF